MLGLHCSAGFSPAAESGAYSLVAARGLLMVVVSLVVEHRLQGAQASVVVAPGLGCSAAAAAAKSLSRVQLCATLETAAHQALPSLGFSRQEHWSGLPFPSPMHESEK